MRCSLMEEEVEEEFKDWAADKEVVIHSVASALKTYSGGFKIYLGSSVVVVQDRICGTLHSVVVMFRLNSVLHSWRQ